MLKKLLPLLGHCCATVETCCTFVVMRTVTIRDLRQRWPEVEAALQAEDEILITRDSRPVAKLVRVAERVPKQKRWSVEEHKKWIRRGCYESFCKLLLMNWLRL